MPDLDSRNKAVRSVTHSLLSCDPSSQVTNNTLKSKDEGVDAKIQFLDTGHFAIETHVVEIASAMQDFLAANVSSLLSKRD